MSHTAICSAILMTVGAIFSLGCCCPGRFAPVGFRPPAVVVQPLQENPAELAHKKTAEEFQRLVAQQLGPNTWAGSLAPNAPVWAKIRQITAQRSYKTNASIGGPFANVPFDENHAAGGILIGFFAGEDDGNHVGFLQPIYLTAQAEQVGKAYGAIHRPVQCLKAKGGYALGGVNLRTGGIIDALTLVYMRVDGERLNPADSYTSATLGGQGGGPTNFASNGGLLIGIHGKTMDRDGFVPAGAIGNLGFLSWP